MRLVCLFVYVLFLAGGLFLCLSICLSVPPRGHRYIYIFCGSFDVHDHACLVFFLTIIIVYVSAPVHSPSRLTCVGADGGDADWDRAHWQSVGLPEL